MRNLRNRLRLLAVLCAGGACTMRYRFCNRDAFGYQALPVS